MFRQLSFFGFIFISICLCGLLLPCTVLAKENDGQNPGSLNIGKRDDTKPEDSSFLHNFKNKIKNAMKANEKAERYLKGDSSATVESSASRFGFIHAFVASLSVIIVSELGDKTFFIAAIMAMRHSRLIVFAGAILALATMTILSAVLGYATTVIPRWFTYYVSSALFAIFGLKMLREGYYMKPDEGMEEYEEVQADLKKRDEEYCKSQTASVEQDMETGVIRSPRRSIIYSFVNKVLIESFSLTFLAEWGDRSQIATIILAARDDVVGVIVGGTLGHALCTGLAVLGGRFIAQRISVRTVTLCGGVIFLLFAMSALVIGPESNS
ncbi:hypothetical protein BOX15_Mlig031712g4 [Macrostomum lignano]|uniref:GDT1 family protein n=1 Tax=Macrostomum lignano TaxID=282301 RepID=A0A267G383_9PLAT|nr:hypothetical protein BOX15_Mlig031712g1 [Macrostomum lignano]PAA79844.1 hypothetical protein BOX15_Mlig031712g4 [Macrostomum lignano]